MSATRFDPAVRNPLRVAVAGAAWPGSSGAWLLGGLAAAAAAGLFAARDAARPAAFVAMLAAWFLLPGVARGGKTPGSMYVSSLADAVADALILVPLAWPLAHASVRLGAAAVAATGLVFVGAYAQVRARSHDYAFAPAPDGAPERAALLAAGMLFPSALLEPALWLIAALGALTAFRVTAIVWRARG